jgi:hypothetical protein
VVGEFSPCLDPRDEDAWFETLRNWIGNPGARQPFESAIRERFSHPTWAQAAEAFFGILGDELGRTDRVGIDAAD